MRGLLIRWHVRVRWCQAVRTEPPAGGCTALVVRGPAW
jgi:hypothetical protein